MILDDIYAFLKAADLARSHAAFSTDYLGHSPRYYDYLRCSGTKPSLRSLLKLAMRLRQIAQVATGASERVAADAFAQGVMSSALARCR